MSELGSEVLGGFLPGPVGDIHIRVAPSGEHRIAVSYSGTLEALIAAGAIDAQMATHDAIDGQRDGRNRPYRREDLGEGQWQFTRWFSSMKHAVDLPGLGGPPLNVDRLKNPNSRPRLVVNKP